MLIPVDADAAVVEPFVSAVERDVLADAVLVLGDEMLHSTNRRLLFDGEDKDQIGLRLDSCFIERPHRGKQRFDVSRIVADSRREDFAVPDLSFNLQAFLKDGVEVGIEDHWLGPAGAFANGDEVAFRVVIDSIELARLEELSDRFGAVALFAGRRVNLGKRDPLREYLIFMTLNMVERALHVCAFHYLPGRSAQVLRGYPRIQ